MIELDGGGHPVWVGSGILGRAAALLPRGRFFLVSDGNVARAGWADRLASSLGSRLLGSHLLPNGEEHKNLRTLETLLDALIEARVERDDHVLALGGGVVGDVAGFAAAVLKRGCGFVQVPTTLLAQADAAIGGKTGVNARQAKNLIGAFHRPSAVIVDAATLATLPARELRCGYAEVVKYGLIGDPVFFAWCEENGAALLAGDERARLHAVLTGIRAKVERVAGDEHDRTGRRALLNFGHTFGHAIEAETGMPHGEAVAVGMAWAFKLSAERDLCPPGDVQRVERHFRSVGLPTRLEGIDPGRLAARMLHDKKRRGGAMRMILTRGIGEAFVDDDVEASEVEAFLTREQRSAAVAVG